MFFNSRLGTWQHHQLLRAKSSWQKRCNSFNSADKWSVDPFKSCWICHDSSGSWIRWYITTAALWALWANSVVNLGGWLQMRGWPHIFCMPQYCLVTKHQNTNLFCQTDDLGRKKQGKAVVLWDILVNLILYLPYMLQKSQNNGRQSCWLMHHILPTSELHKGS